MFSDVLVVVIVKTSILAGVIVIYNVVQRHFWQSAWAYFFYLMNYYIDPL